MDDHQVRERAWLVVPEGEVDIRAADEAVQGGVGTLVTFAPAERHAVRSEAGALLLLVLALWPGEQGQGAGAQPAPDRVVEPLEAGRPEASVLVVGSKAHVGAFEHLHERGRLTVHEQIQTRVSAT